MSQLIYHSEEGYNQGTSPFDRAIREMSNSKELRIVCPYISPNYLKSILTDVDKWQIVTDVEAWLRTFGGSSREEIREFIERNHEQVHHFPDVHAKATLSEDSAVIGSANLTEKAVVRRTEMGVRFTEEEKIYELTQWFNRLWSESSPVELGELREFIDNSQSTPVTHTPSPTSISSDAPRVRASFIDEIGRSKSIQMVEESNEALVKRIQLAPNQEWANSFFELLSDLIAATGLSKNDPRLVTSIPQEKRISISINRRMVLGASFYGEAETGFLIRNDATNVDKLLKLADGYYEFNAQPGEEEGQIPHWVKYEGEPEGMANPSFRRAWINAVFDELDRAKGSPYQGSHEPLVYQMAVNQYYRNQVLSEAFPESRTNI